MDGGKACNDAQDIHNDIGGNIGRLKISRTIGAQRFHHSRLIRERGGNNSAGIVYHNLAVGQGPDETGKGRVYL
ncbi:MAG: hypothetical protein J7L16_03950 [Deltaproteobacteria bacterium]|nr:hypothetical protein [Deltaproteobacteria bacterium]